MIFRACPFYLQVNRALKNGAFTHNKGTLLIGNVQNIIKHHTPKNIKQHIITINKPVCFKSSYSALKWSGLSLSVIGFQVIFSQKAHCNVRKFKLPHVNEETVSRWKKLLSLLYLDLFTWIGAILAALFVAYINVKLPIYLGDLANVIASVVSSSRTELEELPALVKKLVIYYLAQACGTFVYISLLAVAGERLAAKLRYDLYEAYLQQDLTFFENKRTGELLDCLYTDVQEFKSSFKQCVTQGLKNVIQICGCVVSLLKISPLMTFTVISVVPIIVLSGSFFVMMIRRISKTAKTEAVKAFSMSEEVLSNIRTVRSFSNEDLELEKYKQQLRKVTKLQIMVGFGIGLFQAGTNLFMNGLVVGTLYLGSRYIISDRLSPGDLMSFLVTVQMIQKSFSQLSFIFGNFIKGQQSLQRIFHFSELKPSIPISGGIRIPYHSFVPSIEFKNVTFAYPTRPEQIILHELNFTIPAGKTIAIVGASGNGKSTIAHLLERFYDVEQGSVTISDVDIRKLDPHWLRGTIIGIINQEPVLFATTVKENIRFGKPDATDDEVYEAAKQANADDFIKEFPEGYDTMVGERGIAMSGGQKQRIAIARALIKKPLILILDEATSALDPEAEKIVQKTLEKVCLEKTVLVIAHRLSTVQNADLIAVLNKGVIVEMGTHKKLMKMKGAYYRMMTQQKTDAMSRIFG